MINAVYILNDYFDNEEYKDLNDLIKEIKKEPQIFYKLENLSSNIQTLKEQYKILPDGDPKRILIEFLMSGQTLKKCNLEDFEINEEKTDIYLSKNKIKKKIQKFSSTYYFNKLTKQKLETLLSSLIRYSNRIEIFDPYIAQRLVDDSKVEDIEYFKTNRRLKFALPKDKRYKITLEFLYELIEKANFKTSDLEVTTYTSVEYDLNKTFESLSNQTSDLEGYNFAGDLEKYLEKVFFKENQKFKKKFKILERKHEKLEFYKPRGLRFHYNGFRKIIDNGKGINFIKQDKKLDNSSGYSFVCLDRRETDQQLTDWTRFLPEYSVESSIQG